VEKNNRPAIPEARNNICGMWYFNRVVLFLSKIVVLLCQYILKGADMIIIVVQKSNSNSLNSMNSEDVRNWRILGNLLIFFIDPCERFPEFGWPFVCALIALPNGRRGAEPVDDYWI
jgi:hypothetical protein